ncbi:MAG TPA: response regulator transcription factor [Bacillota bacterium]
MLNKSSTDFSLCKKKRHHDANKIKLILIDTNDFYRKRLKYLLELDGSFKRVIEGKSVEQFQSFHEIGFFDWADLLVVELGLCPANNMKYIEAILEDYPNLKIIILTNFPNEAHVIQTIRTGVSGYLLKNNNFNTTVEAIKRVGKGNFVLHPSVTKYIIEDYIHILNQEQKVTPSMPLSNREYDILKLLADGKTNKEIANILAIKQATVKRHMVNMMKKMNVHNRTEAVIKAIRKQWIHV